jgi:hypothetical protein
MSRICRELKTKQNKTLSPKNKESNEEMDIGTE